MRVRDESPGHMKEEGLSLREAGRTLAAAFSAIATTTWLVGIAGPVGFLAFPALVWLFWVNLRREPQAREHVPWVPAVPESAWLEEAYASRQRGTGISTLAVRYDVDPDWLERELSGFAPTPRV